MVDTGCGRCERFFLLHSGFLSFLVYENAFVELTSQLDFREHSENPTGSSRLDTPGVVPELRCPNRSKSIVFGVFLLPKKISLQVS